MKEILEKIVFDSVNSIKNEIVKTLQNTSIFPEESSRNEETQANTQKTAQRTMTAAQQQSQATQPQIITPPSQNVKFYDTSRPERIEINNCRDYEEGGRGANGYAGSEASDTAETRHGERSGASSSGTTGSSSADSTTGASSGNCSSNISSTISAYGRNKRLNIMVIGAAVGLISCMFLLASYRGDLPGEVVGIISTVSGIFGSCLKDAYSFEFGSSRGSKDKDERISSTILEKLSIK